MDNNLQKAAEIIKNAKHVTAFTGAGISVESGIPPFRGKNGLWSKYNPDCLDLNNFLVNPNQSWLVIKEIFYDFFGKAKPNPAHFFIAKLEQNQIVKAVITQNIDNLHQEAGSKKVIEFHGTAQNMVCLQCGFKTHSSEVDLKTIPPLCPECQSVLKPDFIFFGEGIPSGAYTMSEAEARVADVFIVIGTTGEVMPACMIPQKAKNMGCKIIEINPEASNFTHSITDVFLKGPAGEVCKQLDKLIFG